MPSTVISVKQLNLYIKSLLEGDSNLSYISIVGELSNFKSHYASGHLYFTLKDEAATLKCVMFKGNASRLGFSPKEGMRVVCSGRISVFERDGVYQLYCENMTPEGEGDLLAAYEKLKSKLEAEGLFDKSRKKAIPPFPKKVGVITSQTGAAICDIFSVLERRYPLCDILFCPATVQGENAPDELCNALDILYRSDVDVIIIGRGGGSVEDLWCFNDEKLARKISESTKPIISAVGHETDFTICDFVSDLRAPTPSAAAELAVPDRAELYAAVLGFNRLLDGRIYEIVSSREGALKSIVTSGVYTAPEQYICEKRALLLDSLADRLSAQTLSKYSEKEVGFTAVASKLDVLSPLKTMLRGYAVAQKNGETVTSVKNLSKGDKVTLLLSDGKAECTVD